MAPTLAAAAAGALVLCTLALSACGSGGSSTGAAADSSASAHGPLAGRSITLYNGQHEQTTATLVSLFEKRTGAKVDMRTADEAELGNQLLQEGASSPADVLYTENTPVLERLREQGMLARLPPATLAAAPARYSSPAGDWVGVSARVSTLVYNTAQISPASLPSSILALAEPRYRGKLAIAPSETDFQPLIASIAASGGRAQARRWLEGVKANSRLYPSNETVVTQVNNGESAIGLVNDYYWYRLRDELGTGGVHSALHYYAPHDAGYLLSVSGAAVLRSSSHRAAAQAFVAFLLSREGQAAIARGHSYEYPLRPGVAAAGALAPLDTLAPAPVTPAQLGDGSEPLALEQAVGLL